MILKLVNTRPTAATLAIDLDGIIAPANGATAQVLATPDLNDLEVDTVLAEALTVLRGAVRAEVQPA